MKQFLAVLAIACFVGCTFAQPAGADIDCNKPPQNDPDKCCKTPMFFGDALVASCETKIKGRNQNVTAECMANCLVTDNGLMDNSGSLKKDALSAFLIKQTNDSVWNTALTKAVSVCVDDAASRKADFAKMAAGAPCGPYALFGIDCLYMQLFKSCPADRWSKNANCANLKNYVNKCSLV